ncbi:MAG: ABC transporter ATP-binding protein [Olsenella sp.]|nr:ABC transporter ATP-binding protein [Olsenella sp.]
MLELTGVTSGYGGAFALNVPALSFPDGCVTAIVGKNGCGKSTLLKTLAAIIPHQGSVLVDGRELGGLSHTERARHVAYLPQQLPVAAMDVVTLVRHGRFARMGASKVLGPADNEAVRDAMEATGTGELATKRLAEVSGGELQRAYLAMVIAQGARTLLLDEPASHLDPYRQVELMALLARLAEGGSLRGPGLARPAVRVLRGGARRGDAAGHGRVLRPARGGGGAHGRAPARAGGHGQTGAGRGAPLAVRVGKVAGPPAWDCAAADGAAQEEGRTWDTCLTRRASTGR